MPVPQRLPGESITQFAIRVAYLYGHFWGPDNPNGWNVKQSDLKNLSITDPVVVQALRSLSLMDPARYAEVVVAKHMRPPDFDGQFGPALQEFVQLGRCPVPDHAPPPGVVFAFDDPWIQQVVERMQKNAAEPVGSGNWPQCHGIGNFHCAIVRVDASLMPSFLQPIFKDVIVRVQQAYAGVGLLFRFISEAGIDLLTGDNLSGESVNSEMSFVNSSDGWIGLAIVGQNEQCSDKIWCRFLNTYKGGNTPDQIITQWTTLLKHELGHNCGRSHTQGGVMNPSIVNGLPAEWVPGDPSTSWLKSQFGGVPVPIPGGGTPTPPAPPVATIEKRVEDLELQMLIQRGMTKALAEMIGKMRAT